MEKTTTLPIDDAARSDQIARTSLIGVPLLLTAVRCTLQYILLPFVLPLFGLSGTFSAAVNVVVEAFAIGLIFYNIVRLWHTGWRWRYAIFGLIMAAIIGVTLAIDIQALV